LIGVSATGWNNNPHILFNAEVQREGAEIVKATNKLVAKLIGINAAARTTCCKPAGNASVLLKTASGVGGEHSPTYLRYVTFSRETEVAKTFLETNPSMCEPRVNSDTDIMVAFPCVSSEHSIYKKDIYGTIQMEQVMLTQQNWIEYGTNVELCTDVRLRHNVSNTITVDDWDAVARFAYDNRQWFCGLSFMGIYGEKEYAQAPFTTVYTEQQLLDMYGTGALFASGMIVDALHAFSENLWLACSTARGYGEHLDVNTNNALKIDWVRRFDKFANNYFNGDKELTSHCLKDVHNLHKWERIQHSLVDIDWGKALTKQVEIDIDVMGGAACSIDFATGQSTCK